MTEDQPDILADLRADIRFGVTGNSTDYQLSGWSFPEEGFTWSVGPRSVLKLPPCRGGQDLLLILEGVPFLQLPTLCSQLVRVTHQGRKLADFRVTTAFVRSIRIRVRSVANLPTAVELHYPDHARPAAFGSNDCRSLAIAWRRIRAVGIPASHQGGKLPSSDDMLHRNNFPCTFAPDSTSDRQQPARRSTRKPVALAPVNLGGPARFPGGLALRSLIIEGLRTDNPETAAAIVASACGMPGLALALNSSISNDISVVDCTMKANGSWTFGFSPAWRCVDSNNPAAKMVAWHWLATLPLFAAYSYQELLPGSFLLSLGDEAHARGVAFCANNDTSLLIPDPYFLRSMGYQAIKAAFDSSMPSFLERKRTALWRGSTTGYRHTGGLFDLPRVRLCLRAREPEAIGLVDAGFTGFVQLQYGEEERLRAMDLARPFVEPERLPEWKLHIDIDGNTNSWPGLFTKLLSGAAILKVASPEKWRQWYYDRLEPQTNFMPVSTDLSDLVGKVKYLAYCIAEAEELGSQGRKLALSMSYEHEIIQAIATLEEAVVQEALLRADRDPSFTGRNVNG